MHSDEQSRVPTRRLEAGVGRTDDAVLVAVVVLLEELVVRRARALDDAGEADALVVAVDLELLLARRVEQVLQLVEVDLDERELDGVHALGVLGRLGEDVLHRARDDALVALVEVTHGVRLAGTGLAVHEQRTPEALEDVLDDGAADLEVDLVVVGAGAVVHVVKVELLVALRHEHDRLLVLLHLHQVRLALALLDFILLGRTDAQEDHDAVGVATLFVVAHG
mmetsp:Transcript_13534/g.42122  ORF Transcript_13534/g.42122 Transcript_13534/m.42122 type:complete len:223 (-) Transcript_13534:106-774(-)